MNGTLSKKLIAHNKNDNLGDISALLNLEVVESIIDNTLIILPAK